MLLIYGLVDESADALVLSKRQQCVHILLTSCRGQHAITAWINIHEMEKFDKFVLSLFAPSYHNMCWNI